MTTDDMTLGEIGRGLGRVELAVDQLKQRVRRLELLGAVGVGIGAAAGTGVAQLAAALFGGGA